MTEVHTLQALVGALARHGEAPALIADRDGTLETRSFAQLVDDSLRLAAGLGERGLRHGDTVAILAAEGPDWITAALAVFAAGAVLVPLDAMLRDEDIVLQLRDSNCTTMFTCAAHLARLQGLTRTVPLSLVLLDDAPGDAGGAPHWRTLLSDAPAAESEAGPDDVAALFYTSGTTGTPKGVPLTHGNLIANLDRLGAESMIGPGDRFLMPLPLFHVYPLVVGVLAPLAAGVAVAFPTGLAGPEIARALRVSGASVLIGVPRLFAALLDAIKARLAIRGRFAGPVLGMVLAAVTRLPDRARRTAGRLAFGPVRRALSPSLRLLVCGGARLDPAHWRQLEALGWDVLTGYGLTETAPILTFNLPGRVRVGTTGSPLPGVELRIDAADGDGIGEIQARGPNVFGGYHNLPQETAAVFTADGWFRTGDLGFVDGDGFLHVEGRAKEMIVLPDGRNVFPEEVEAAYGASPMIGEMAAVERGEGLAGLVVPDLDAVRARGTANLGQVIRDELRKIALTLPTHYRLSGHVLTRGPLPRTSTGKLRRHVLAELYDSAASRAVSPPTAAMSAEDTALLAQPPAGEIWAWLQTRFPATPLSPDTSPQLDLGIDSLAWTGLSLEIEDRFGIRLGEERMMRIVTLRDLLREAAAAAATPEAGPAPGPAPGAVRFRLPPEPGAALRLLSAAFYWFNRLVLRNLFRLRIEGGDRLPPGGPYVIVPNHNSYLDPLVIAAALPLATMRQVYFGGWTGLLFRGPFSRAFSRLAQVFPVDPIRAAGASLDLARSVLDRNGILVWFPEGARSPTGALQAFLPGIGALVRDAGAPAVPVRISGTFEAAPSGRLIPRLRHLHVAFGKPAPAADLERLGAGETAAARIADGLRRTVAALDGPQSGNGW